jgi:hypothetical protein
MNWRRYSGIIEFRKGQKERTARILKDFPVPDFFVDAGSYYLIDGIYPDVTKELVATLERIQGHTGKVKIQIAPAHIRDVAEWAEETYSQVHERRNRACANT